MASVFVPITVTANVIKIGDTCYKFKAMSPNPPTSVPDEEFEDCDTCTADKCLFTWEVFWDCEEHEYSAIEPVGTPVCTKDCEISAHDWEFDRKEDMKCYYKAVTCEFSCVDTPACELETGTPPDHLPNDGEAPPPEECDCFEPGWYCGEEKEFDSLEDCETAGGGDPVDCIYLAAMPVCYEGGPFWYKFLIDSGPYATYEECAEHCAPDPGLYYCLHYNMYESRDCSGEPFTSGTTCGLGSLLGTCTDLVTHSVRFDAIVSGPWPWPCTGHCI